MPPPAFLQTYGFRNASLLLSRFVVKHVEQKPSAACRPHKVHVQGFKNVEQMFVNLAITLIVSATVLSYSLLVTGSADGVEMLFQRSCAGCHDRGGNILQPGATLSAADLQKNGIASVDDIFKITYFGKGRMPGFGEQCTPRGQCTFGPRLSDEDIRSLAEFVRLQAEKGWPNSH